MNTFVLILGICCLPALAGIIPTLPLWFIRQLNNNMIHVLGLFFFFGSFTIGFSDLVINAIYNCGFGYTFLSVTNIFLFRAYERLLFTTRCPECHTMQLRVRTRRKKTYKLYCCKCKMHSQWDTSQFFAKEWN